MSVVAIADVGDVETRQERALRRTASLRNAFQSVFETLAEIYRDEDWRYVNDMTGIPYSGFTAFVQDQLGCAASNARRYQQGIVGLVLPLQELVLPGARIPVTSADVARLGVAGARVVVEEAPMVLQEVGDCDGQSVVLRELIDSVLKRTSSPGFGPVKSSVSQEPSVGDLVPSTLPPAAPGSGGLQGWDEPCADEPCAGPGASWSDTAGRGREQEVAALLAGSGAGAANTGGSVGDLLGSSPRPEPMSLESDSVVGVESSAGEAVVVGVDGVAGLTAAVGAVLAAEDPAALADLVPARQSASLAVDCLAAAQRLARLGQLLRSVSA